MRSVSADWASEAAPTKTRKTRRHGTATARPGRCIVFFFRTRFLWHWHSRFAPVDICKPIRGQAEQIYSARASRISWAMANGDSTRRKRLPVVSHATDTRNLCGGRSVARGVRCTDRPEFERQKEEC